MKKVYITIIAAIIALILISCEAPTKTTQSSPDLSTDTESIDSSKNSQNGSQIIEQDGWVYYRLDGKLYKEKTDGTQKQVLYDNRYRNLIIVGDWIYFSGMRPDDGGEENSMNEPFDGNEGIYRVKKDGTDFEKISDHVGIGMSVMDDTIYFVDGDLYKMNMDGSNVTLLIDTESDNIDYLTQISVYDDQLLYTCDLYIYYISSPGSTPQKLDFLNSSIKEIMGDGWIYFLTSAWRVDSSIEHDKANKDNWSLYKVRIDGSDMTKIAADGNIKQICLCDGWIYYTTDDYWLIKIKTDGTEANELLKADHNISTITITNGWIYIGYDYSGGKPSEMYKMKTDGAEYQLWKTY